MDFTKSELDVLSLLRVGVDNAVSSRYIEKATGLPNRWVRKTIRQLRLKGKCICSGDEGYYIASSPDEVKRTVKRYESMGLNTLKMADAIKQAHGDIF